MGFFKRLFSADYRAAVAAEAAGDLELAAERYALAGYHDAAARMHLARAERAISHAEEIEALRDALHWAPEEGDLRQPVMAALGRALLTRARAEGVATARDRERVREAARFLEEAEEWQEAGDAWESIGEDSEAARAYGNGGLVNRLETVLARGSEKSDRTRTLREAYADYEMHLHGGDRDAAREALRICVEHAENKADYRRLLDELESRLITGSHVVLRKRGGQRVTIAARSPLLLGRDALCDLELRAGGVSRRHAEIHVGSENGVRFSLADAGSRNGTMIGGLPIKGAVPLIDRGRFALGEVYELEYETHDQPSILVVRVVRGLDQGAVLVACDAGVNVPLAEIAGLPLSVRFVNGRPYALPQPPSTTLLVGGRPAAHGATQLIHGDLLTVGPDELEVS